ncbi:Bifunctional NAD(P)H-hydrate repair enzyme Nnr [Thalassocella blandensis]|nr:Bifunctional NAD(P)H-hydrate repair enzyme Nnr [Thalassocella blandensis]
MTFQKSLPTDLYLCQQARELDKRAAEYEEIATIVLMKRAGKAAYDCLRQRYGDVPLVIVCGAGNNAGDGYVVAALAAQRKQSVSVLYLSDPNTLTGDALKAYRYAQQEGVAIAAFTESELTQQGADVVLVDALLGTGFTPPLRSEYGHAIQCINQLEQKKFSLDIPSGLNGDTGQADQAVVADACISFIALKPGLLTAEGPNFTGELYFADLGVPASIFEHMPSALKRLDLDQVLPLKPLRLPASHKGSHGKVLVCGGDLGLGGAAMLAAETALFSGAGLIALATQAAHVSPALVRAPEVMTFAVENPSQIETGQYYSCVVAGPGLGQSAWSEQVLLAALHLEIPMVVDADALNLLAKYGLEHFSTKRENWILTPHPGEAARLLDTSILAVQRDRVQAAKLLQKKFGGVIVLKGAGTVIASAEEIYIANVGNAALAAGGMGDVLSGLIGALLAQGLRVEEAAKLAVCVHGAAGVAVSQENGGLLGVRASELLPAIRQLLN